MDRDFFETMVESVGVGVAIYGSDGRFEYVNEAYASLFDVDIETLTGRALWEVNPEFERERFEAYWESFDEGETRLTETEHAFNGITVPVETITTRHHIDGTPYNFGTIQDITERRRRKRQLQRQNDRLDKFASIISHDLRNPLSVAIGYLEVAREGDEAAFEQIDEALTRMHSILEETLASAREGRTIGQLEPVEIAQVVHESWAMVSTESATLSCSIEQHIEADEEALRQLFENLFRNAVDHGGESVTVTVDWEEPDTLVIEDDGVGIPESIRSTVFDEGMTTTDHGRGIGLSIVYEIVDAHEWTITAEESEAGGARFEIAGLETAGDVDERVAKIDR